MAVVQGTRRGDFTAAAGLLVLALLFGGGSAISPIQRMIVELAGVLVIGWFFIRGWCAPVGSSVRIALILIALIVVLTLLQTVPLPPAIWRALPGRQPVVAIMDVAGATDAWLPLSLDSSATREAALFLIVPVAMFVATLHLDRNMQLRLVLLVVAAAVLSALLVMIQAQGATWLTFYDAPHATKGKGIFANKNHDAALLVLAIPLAAMLGSSMSFVRQPATQRILTVVVIAFLGIAVLGCLSRAGLALLPIALVVCIPLLGGWSLVRQHWKIAVFTIMALITVLAVIAQSAIVQETFDRFGANQEGRYVFWPDVIAAIRQFMPWGSGLGTFVPVFRMNESLEAVHQTYTNHAHSDYLEIALEAGVWGVGLTIAFLAWFCITAWTRLKSGTGTPSIGPMLASVTAIALLLMASIVDYPLRTLLLSSVFAMLAAIIASPVPFNVTAAYRSGNRTR